MSLTHKCKALWSSGLEGFIMCSGVFRGGAVAARRGSVRGNCPGRQKEGAPKEGGFSQGRGDKYDICPRAPKTLAPPLGGGGV
jgi:hypothetical protein